MTRRGTHLQIYDRHGLRTLAHLAARLSAADCEAAQWEIWNRAVPADAKPAAWLIRRARTIVRVRTGNNKPAPWAERHTRLRAVLADLDGGQRQLLRLRWANASAGDMARATGRRPEFALRFADEAVTRLTEKWQDGKLVLSAFPALRTDLGHWLERQLVGGRLGDLIAELAAVHFATARLKVYLPPLLRGHRKAAVLNAGFAGLSERRHIALLRHPRLLLDLQELVLAFGGKYWDSVRPGDDRLGGMASRIRLRLEARAA